VHFVNAAIQNGDANPCILIPVLSDAIMHPRQFSKPLFCPSGPGHQQRDVGSYCSSELKEIFVEKEEKTVVRLSMSGLMMRMVQKARPKVKKAMLRKSCFRLP
jgi:hypothetical protein